MEKKTKVYLSGPISGVPESQYKAAFNNAELWLTGLGYDVVNPISYDPVPGELWEDYMKRDLKLLLDCDYIFMLEGFSASKGAMIEFNLAVSLGIKPIEIDEVGNVIAL